MISKITLSNIATYTMATAEPKKINFIYGGNGTGKTTLSRFLAGEDANSDSIIEWTSTVHEKSLFITVILLKEISAQIKHFPVYLRLGPNRLIFKMKLKI